MNSSLELLYTSLTLSANTFGWVLLGLLLLRFGWVNVARIELLSRFSFRWILPLLLLSGAAQLDWAEPRSSRYIVIGAIATLANLLLSWGYARLQQLPREQTGVFVQAAFRSNLAIIGVALCATAYGNSGVTVAALAIAAWTALYNVFAVWVLGATMSDQRLSLKRIAIDIGKNPLILGIVAGLLISLPAGPPAPFIGQLGGLISTFYLPLILISIGATMNLAQLRGSGAVAWKAVGWRLILAPTLSVGLAYACGVRDIELGVLFLLMASPAAAASFIMVVAYRGDGTLAANVLMLTTLLSAITVPVGFFLLSALSVI
jgi:predicted permease